MHLSLEDLLCVHICTLRTMGPTLMKKPQIFLQSYNFQHLLTFGRLNFAGRLVIYEYITERDIEIFNLGCSTTVHKSSRVERAWHNAILLLLL